MGYSILILLYMEYKRKYYIKIIKRYFYNSNKFLLLFLLIYDNIFLVKKEKFIYVIDKMSNGNVPNGQGGKYE